MYHRIVIVLLLVGTIVQAIGVYMHPTVYNFIVIGISWLLKVILAFYTYRLYGSCQIGCVGNIDDHVDAYEIEITTRTSDEVYREEINKSMTSVNSLQAGLRV